jgi:hypothetical protein
VEALGAGLDRPDHGVERLGRHRDDFGRIERPPDGGAAAAEHEAQAKIARRREDHVRRIEPVRVGKHVVVIRRRGGARQQKFDEPNARCDVEALLVDFLPVGVRHHPQPLEQRRIEARAHAFEDALEEMMMGGDEAGIDDTAGSVDDCLARFRREFANRRDPAVGDADRPRRAHGVAGKSGENPVRPTDQRRGHVRAA